MPNGLWLPKEDLIKLSEGRSFSISETKEPNKIVYPIYKVFDGTPILLGTDSFETPAELEEAIIQTFVGYFNLLKSIKEVDIFYRCKKNDDLSGFIGIYKGTAEKQNTDKAFGQLIKKKYENVEFERCSVLLSEPDGNHKRNEIYQHRKLTFIVNS